MQGSAQVSSKPGFACRGSDECNSDGCELSFLTGHPGPP